LQDFRVEVCGIETAAKIWRKYPVLDFGKKWDVGKKWEGDWKRPG